MEEETTTRERNTDGMAVLWGLAGNLAPVNHFLNSQKWDLSVTYKRHMAAPLQMQKKAREEYSMRERTASSSTLTWRGWRGMTVLCVDLNLNEGDECIEAMQL